MKRQKLLSLLLLLAWPIFIQAQYYGDRPLEMTFEQSDFFFTPLYVNPLGVAGFTGSSLLLFDDPLTGIERNPANLSRFDGDSIPSNYLYLDMRNSRRVVNNRYGIFPCLYDCMPSWGYYYSNERAELSPLMSAAYLTRLPIFRKSITLGATYQVITQGESYYAIPFDIYRNVAGMDMMGTNYAGMEGYQITDRFSGSDYMYHEGHAINTFMSFELNDAWTLGVNVSRFIFDRDGSFGSDNLWNSQVNYLSYWKSFEGRTQEYNHWDYTLGLIYTTGANRFGLNAGLLTGDVTQQLSRNDESMSKSGQSNSSNYSDYQSWYVSDQSWNHKGMNYHGGIQWDRKIRDDLSFRFMYRLAKGVQDIDLKSSIESESSNEYRYSSGNYTSESEGNGKMHDFRDGAGKREMLSHNVNSALTWRFGSGQSLRLGAIFGYHKQLTDTKERADAFSESYYYWFYDDGNNSNASEHYYKTVEDKSINWKFSSRLRSIHIPIVYESKISDRIEILLGMNRTMNFWLIENSTLILYDYRERVINEVTQIEQKTGERIKEPDERYGVVNTKLLGGVTISPSKRFSVQLLVAPGFEKNSLTNEYRSGIQFWMGMNLHL